MTLRTEKATTINIGGKGGHAWAMKMGGGLRAKVEDRE